MWIRSLTASGTPAMHVKHFGCLSLRLSEEQAPDGTRFYGVSCFPLIVPQAMHAENITEAQHAAEALVLQVLLHHVQLLQPPIPQ